MFEEEESRPTASTPLERLSVEDLQARIEDLKAEILRCEAELEKKQAHKAAADSFFKSDS